MIRSNKIEGVVKIKTPAYLKTTEGLIQAINLFDEIVIETLNERKIQIEKKKGYKIPTNDLNPVFKVASALQRLRPNKLGAKIIIEKNIPTSSGLSSQLSNAVGVLLSLNELWNFKLTTKELLTIAKKADQKLPELMQHKNKEVKKVVVIVPKYIKFKKGWTPDEISSHFPDIKNIKEELIRMGATESGISGKGPALYGFFNDPISIKLIKKEFKEKTDFVWSGKTVNGKINSNK